MCKPSVHNGCYTARLFKEHDRNHDGCLEYSEVAEILRKIGIADQKEIERLIRAIDTERNGNVNFNSFLAATLHSSVYKSNNRMEMAFNLFDVEKRGSISLANIKKVIKDVNISEAEWNAIVEELDKEGKGQLTFEAFVRMMSL
jgi:calcium-dependent protein kinase